MTTLTSTPSQSRVTAIFDEFFAHWIFQLEVTGTGEPEQTASAAEGTLGRGTRRAATSTDYGGPVTRRRRADDGEAEQSRRARRGREQDVAEISRRMYDEIRSSRDPRDHVEDG